MTTAMPPVVDRDTWHTSGRGTEQLSHSFPLIDLLPYGRQEEWQDSPRRLAAASDLQRLGELAAHCGVVRRRCPLRSVECVTAELAIIDDGGGR